MVDDPHDLDRAITQLRRSGFDRIAAFQEGFNDGAEHCKDAFGTTDFRADLAKFDEGVLNACGTCGDAPEEVCDGLDNDCNGCADDERASLIAPAASGLDSDETFGYFSIAGVVTVPFSSHWNVHGGAELQTFGDRLKAVNGFGDDGDRGYAGIASIGIGFSY